MCVVHDCTHTRERCKSGQTDRDAEIKKEKDKKEERKEEEKKKHQRTAFATRQC